MFKTDKQLRILLYSVTTVVLIMSFIIGILASNYIGDHIVLQNLQRSVARLQDKGTPIAIQPHNGIDGYTPIKGIDYFDGKDGKDGKDSMSTQTIKEVPVTGKDGKDGKDGEPGAPGLQVEIKLDEATCTLMSRYTGDDIWSVLAQLPKPCKKDEQ